MRTEHLREAEDPLSLFESAYPLGSARESRDEEGVSVLKHPPFGDDRAWDQKDGFCESQQGERPATGWI